MLRRHLHRVEKRRQERHLSRDHEQQWRQAPAPDALLRPRLTAAAIAASDELLGAGPERLIKHAVFRAPVLALGLAARHALRILHRIPAESSLLCLR